MNIEAKALYPIVGGYNQYPVSLKVGYEEPIRSTEIKGLWKWWTRILIESAIERKRHGVTKYNDLNKLLEDFFGSTNFKSPIRVRIEIEDNFITIFKAIWDFIIRILENRKVTVKSENTQNLNIADTIIIPTININIGNSTIFKITENNHVIRVKRENNPENNTLNITLDLNAKKLTATLNNNQIELKLRDKTLDKYLRLDKLSDFLSIPRIMLDLLKYNNKGVIVSNEITSTESEILADIIMEILTAFLIPKEIKFRIIVEVDKERINKEKLRFALYSLLIFLIMGGIGRISNRGLGSLSPLSLECKDKELCGDLQSRFDNFKRISRDKELSEFIRRLINETMSMLNDEITKTIRMDKYKDIFFFSDSSLRYILAKQVKEPIKAINMLGKATSLRNVGGRNFAEEVFGSPRGSNKHRSPSLFRFKILEIQGKYYLLQYFLDKYDKNKKRLIDKYKNKINEFINKIKISEDVT